MTTLGDVSAGRDNNFNLLRMIAAAAVLVSHAYPICYGRGAAEPLQSSLDGIKLGTVAVYVFFALSGYFITKSFDRGRSTVRFVKARVLRLYPGLFVVLVLTVIAAALLLSSEPARVVWAAAPGYLADNLLLYKTRPYLPGVFETLPLPSAINVSIWTLFYEVACYAGVLLAGLAGLLRRPRLVLAGTALLFLLALARHPLDLPGRVDTMIELGYPFALGACAYVWRDRIPLSLGLGLALALVAGLARGTPGFPALFPLALAYASLALGFARIPFLRAYNRLGDYSYGTYIYAFPMQQLMALAGTRDPLMNIATALPLTLLCAMASWHFIEKPALHLVKHTA